MLSDLVMQTIQEKLGERVDDYLIPPPVFTTMQGQFVAFDEKEGILKTRFPVLIAYSNPYKAMQGGMIAAAVDNTLGPLSMLVAPPNVTRRLEMKYSHPVIPEMGFIEVQARFLGREGQLLNFSAEVRDMGGRLLARAKASHWILET